MEIKVCKSSTRASTPNLRERLNLFWPLFALFARGDSLFRFSSHTHLFGPMKKGKKYIREKGPLTPSEEKKAASLKLEVVTFEQIPFI